MLAKTRKKPVPVADTATDVAAADINKNKENNNATIS